MGSFRLLYSSIASEWQLNKSCTSLVACETRSTSCPLPLSTWPLLPQNLSFVWLIFAATELNTLFSGCPLLLQNSTHTFEWLNVAASKLNKHFWMSHCCPHKTHLFFWLATKLDLKFLHTNLQDSHKKIKWRSSFAQPPVGIWSGISVSDSDRQAADNIEWLSTDWKSANVL